MWRVKRDFNFNFAKNSTIYPSDAKFLNEQMREGDIFFIGSLCVRCVYIFANFPINVARAIPQVHGVSAQK